MVAGDMVDKLKLALIDIQLNLKTSYSRRFRRKPVFGGTTVYTNRTINSQGVKTMHQIFKSLAHAKFTIQNHRLICQPSMFEQMPVLNA